MCLVICTTPLQMLIAYELINLKIKSEKIDVLILTNNLNKKYLYYIEILRRNSFISNVFVIEKEDKNILKKLINLNKVRKWCEDRLYDVAYVASIDNAYIHLILDKCCIQEIYTFDDGTMNIIDDSDYFLDRESFFSKFIRIFLDLKWNLAEIKMETRKHYTIYHDMKNIVENTENIDLFGTKTKNLNGVKGKQERINIYVGQPFLNKESSVKIYRKLMAKNKNIKYYIHPREDFSFIASQLPLENILQSDLIVEDFVILLLNQGYKINLFTISSSAGLNLYSIGNVTVYFVLEESLANEVAGFFNLVEQKELRRISI